MGDVQNVINKVQENVREMSSYMEENSRKLTSQNEIFLSTFSGIEEMIGLLQKSIEDISAMNAVHKKQEEVIRKTVTINESIADSIEHEYEEFSNISNMVKNNATDIMQMKEQVDRINEMIAQMDEILNS